MWIWSISRTDRKLMLYRKLGRTNLLVSEIGLGALEIGRDWGIGNDNSRPSEEDAKELLLRALDIGINFIDTAPAYQLSEERIGKALKGKRNQFYVATKCGEWFDGKESVYDYSSSETRKFIESSLRRLQTDYIDLIQIHSGSAQVVQEGETLRAMEDAQREGKVRFFGISCDKTDAAFAAIENGRFDAIQVSFNPLFMDMEEVLKIAGERNIGVVIKDCLARGRLSGKSRLFADDKLKKSVGKLETLAKDKGMQLSELSLRFVLARAAVSTIIVGTKRIEHLEKNVASSDGKVLSSEVLQSIMKIK
jgi:aryl-alcohol dehydrogenase-like predicted oxidoreductase